MKYQKLSNQFTEFFKLAIRMLEIAEADAVLIFVDGMPEWDKLKAIAENRKVIVAADREEFLQGIEETDLHGVVVELEESPILEKLMHALVEAVANDQLSTGAKVVALYSGFDEERIDTISFIRLDERLGRLTSRDLRKLETSVPLETLKIVVDLAVEIGREGREGKPVGTCFVVGDHRKVLLNSAPSGFDPLKGYAKKDRHIADRSVRENLKEIAQLDGAFGLCRSMFVRRRWASLLQNSPPRPVVGAAVLARPRARRPLSQGRLRVALDRGSALPRPHHGRHGRIASRMCQPRGLHHQHQR